LASAALSCPHRQHDPDDVSLVDLSILDSVSQFFQDEHANTTQLTIFYRNCFRVRGRLGSDVERDAMVGDFDYHRQAAWA